MQVGPLLDAPKIGAECVTIEERPVAFLRHPTLPFDLPPEHGPGILGR